MFKSRSRYLIIKHLQNHVSAFFYWSLILESDFLANHSKVFQCIIEHFLILIGKAGSVDHPSPEYDKLFKHQNAKVFALSIRIGPKWSGGPFFPLKGPVSLFLNAKFMFRFFYSLIIAVLPNDARTFFVPSYFNNFIPKPGDSETCIFPSLIL